MNISASQRALVMQGGALEANECYFSYSGVTINVMGDKAEISMTDVSFSDIPSLPLTLADHTFDAKISLTRCKFLRNVGGADFALTDSEITLNDCQVAEMVAESGAQEPLRVSGGHLVIQKLRITSSQNCQQAVFNCKSIDASQISMDASCAGGMTMTAPTISIISSAFNSTQRGLLISSSSVSISKSTFWNSVNPITFRSIASGSSFVSDCQFRRTGPFTYIDYTHLVVWHGVVESCDFYSTSNSALSFFGGMWEVHNVTVHSINDEGIQWEVHAIRYRGFGDGSGSTSPPTELVISDCTINGASTIDDGAAVLAQYCDGVYIVGSTFTGNSARRGGAIYASSVRNITINDCSFDQNVAEDQGGAIYTVGHYYLQVDGCTLLNNEAAEAGSIYIEGADGGAAYLTSSSFVGTSSPLVYVDCNSFVQIDQISMNPGDFFGFSCPDSSSCNATIAFVEGDSITITNPDLSLTDVVEGTCSVTGVILSKSHWLGWLTCAGLVVSVIIVLISIGIYTYKKERSMEHYMYEPANIN